MNIFRRNGHNATADPGAQLREAVQQVEQQYDDSLLFMRERLAELELALEDRGWERLMMDGERELSRDGLRRICALSRLMYLKNPLINRAVSIQAAYVFGQGVNINSNDEATNTIIQAFVDDPANQAELTSHQARMLKEVDLTVLGNIFFVLFTGVDGAVKVRTLPVDEVVDIICNPEDAKEKWYYKRVWTPRTFDLSSGLYQGQQEEAFYPDWRYNPGVKPQTINGKRVEWASPVYHMKVGGMSDMRFGVPETYAALDWATAYKNFLEDWATIARALSRFAWNLTTTGGSRGVAAAKTKLNSTVGMGGVETNPPPVAGATFVGTDQTKLDPVRTAGANASAEDGRRLLLMVAAATGLPETFFGDASVGTLATAKSLDRPTELKMIDRRTLWGDTFKDLIGYVLAKKEQPGGLTIVMNADVQIDVTFPALLEHAVKEAVDAIVSAATLDGKALAGTMEVELVARMLLTALGEDDVDELLAGMDFAAMAPDPAAPIDPNNPPSNLTPKESLYLEALREVRRARAEVMP